MLTWIWITAALGAPPDVSGRVFVGGGVAYDTTRRRAGVMEAGVAVHAGGPHVQASATCDVALVRDTAERGVPLFGVLAGLRTTPWDLPVVPWAAAHVGAVVAVSGPKPAGGLSVGVGIPTGDGVRFDVAVTTLGVVDGARPGLVSLLQLGVGL